MANSMLSRERAWALVTEHVQTTVPVQREEIRVEREPITVVLLRDRSGSVEEHFTLVQNAAALRYQT